MFVVLLKNNKSNVLLEGTGELCKISFELYVMW